VILERADYERVAPGLTPPIGAVRYDQDVGVLLPGPFAACEASIRAAGGLAPWQ
jgi:hypothetical protein